MSTVRLAQIDWAVRAGLSNQARVWLSVTLATAFVLRFYVVAKQLYFSHSDEIFQYFEQGHRLAFGSGIKPWEYFDGVRSWLLPGLIAGIMRATSPFGDDPMLYIWATKAACATLSLSVVYVGFRYALLRDGLVGAVVAGMVCAIWFELVYFAPVVMGEIVAAHCAIWAVYLSDTSRSKATETKWRLVASGALLGLAAYMRLQYAPAVVVALVWQGPNPLWRYRWLALGCLTILTLGGLFDAVTLGTPFQSLWLYALRNLRDGVATSFGVRPWYYFVLEGIHVWHAAAILCVFALVGAYRAPRIAAVCLTTLITHSFVTHKEYRFIYLALACAPVLIGLGMGATTSWIAARCSTSVVRSVAAGLILLAVLASWDVATHGLLSVGSDLPTPQIQAFRAAHDQLDLCGLGADDWSLTGGYTYLNRDVPIYLSDFGAFQKRAESAKRGQLAVILRDHVVPQLSTEDFPRNADRYNYLVAQAGTTQTGFSPLVCFDDVSKKGRPKICLFRREGGCGGLKSGASP